MDTNELLNDTFMAISMLDEVKSNLEYAEIINDVNKINTALNGNLIIENGIAYDWNGLFCNLYNKYMQKPEFRIILESYQNRFDNFNTGNNQPNNQNEILRNSLYNLRKWIVRYFLVKYAENICGKMYIEKYKNVSLARNINELEERTSQVDEELCKDLRKNKNE